MSRKNNWQGWTKETVRRSKVGHLNPHVFQPQEKNKKPFIAGGKKVSKHFKKRSVEKDWLAWNLLVWSNEHAVIMEEEYHFHETRNWRFDYAWESLMVAVEYDGLFSEKSRHTTAKGFTGDTDKINAAQQLGWTVFRVTPLNYQTILKTLNDFYERFSSLLNSKKDSPLISGCGSLPGNTVKVPGE